MKLIYICTISALVLSALVSAVPMPGVAKQALIAQRAAEKKAAAQAKQAEFDTLQAEKIADAQGKASNLQLRTDMYKSKNQAYYDAQMALVHRWHTQRLTQNAMTDKKKAFKENSNAEHQVSFADRQAFHQQRVQNKNAAVAAKPHT